MLFYFFLEFSVCIVHFHFVAHYSNIVLIVKLAHVLSHCLCSFQCVQECCLIFCKFLFFHWFFFCPSIQVSELLQYGAPLHDVDSYASILVTLTQIASSGRTSSAYCINPLHPNDPYMGCRVLGWVSKWHKIYISQLWPFLYSPVGFFLWVLFVF